MFQKIDPNSGIGIERASNKAAQNGIVFVVFLALLISFFLFINPILASEVTGNLSTGQIEGNAASSASTDQASISTTSAPSCGDAPPGAKAPWLYGAIAQDSSSVLLYFTPSDDPVSNYVLEYGTKSGDYSYGIQDMGVNSRSQMTFLVESLSSNTTYYFRVRGGNGCATGTWSNEISAKTKGLVSFYQLDITDSTLETIPVEEPSSAKTTASEAKPSPTKTPNTATATNETPTEAGYKVKVKVIDTSKKPIQGATVTIHSNPQTTKTDKNGIASFTNVEAGEHKVLIAYNNFEGEQTVNLTGDVKEFNLNVTVSGKAISLSPLAYVIIGVLILIVLVLIVLLKKSKAKTAGLLLATLVAASSFFIIPNTVFAAGNLTVTQITSVKTYAETDNTYANGWSWTFDVTVPTNETALQMKFADWTSGSDTIPTADNMRIYFPQSTNAANEGSAITNDAANTYGGVMNIDPISDLDAVTDGIQVQITVEVKIPSGATDGSYSTTYGIQTIDPDIAFVAADKAALTDASIKGANPDLASITIGLTNPLPSSGTNGSTITWVSDATSVVSSNGQTINRPLSTSENATVILTATLTKGAVTDTKAFTLTVTRNTGVQATSTFNPTAGAIAFGTTVTITSAGADAIYYTTDGSDPTTSSTNQATTPLVINAAVTVKALAVQAGNDNSAIGSAAYTQATTANLTGLALSGSPANYTFASGTYDYTGVTVLNAVASITVTPTGSGTITVDGTTVVSGEASGEIALTAGVEKSIPVIAAETGKSAKTYTINVTRNTGVQATPTFSPVAGAVAWGTTVTITSSGADAIYFTTDGTDPTTASTNQATTPLVISSAVTVKALAVRAGYDNSAIGSAAYTQATATVPSSIVLAVGSTAPVGGVTNVAIPAAGATNTTGAVRGWVTTTADKIKFTVTDNGGTSTITIGGDAYTSGANYQIPSISSLSIVVTTTQTGKITGVRTFTVTVAALGTSIGDSFQGGKVAYILQSGDPGYVAGQTHGLIAATADQSTGIAWITGGSTQTTSNGNTLTALGTGQANTNFMIAQTDYTGGAAQVCDDYTNPDTGTGVYSDWYLPSQDELTKLFINKTAIGGFAATYYRSSSENSAIQAWVYFFFSSGASTTLSKTSLSRVRAVRTF